MKALILTLTALLPLMAQDAPRPRGQRMAQALHLTADQQSKIQALRADHRVAMASQHQAAREARAALTKAMQDPATPEATLRSLHQKAAEAHFQVLLARRANLAQIRALLTPEQQERAKLLQADHQDRMRGRMRRMRMTPRD